MLKWKIKQILLKVAITILALYAATMLVGKFTQPQVDTYKVITQDEQISSNEVIISQEMILSKLQQESQIVSMSQTLEESFTHVDEGLLGDRVTELNVKGSFKMGLETRDIKVNYIDRAAGIVHISLGDPKLISLEIPYAQVEFDKTKGWARLSMSVEAQKKYYKAVHKSIENDILHNEEILKQAKLFNEDSVREILMLIDNVKGVVFE